MGREQFQPKNIAAGFTLIELIIVITIASLIASVTVVALDQSRQSSRNEAVVAQMHEYQKALELYRAAAGEYPSPSPASQVVCLADEPMFNCIGDQFDSDGPAIRTELTIFQSYFPYFDQGAHGGPAYSGCSGDGGLTDFDICNSQTYSIFFTLEGGGADCGGRAVAVEDATIESDYTLCRLSS